MLIFSWDVMVGRSNGFARSEYGNIAFFQPIKSLRTGNLVYVMSVDIENIRSICDGFYYMAVPDFVEKCF
jgi:hypothetical protein